MQPTALHCNRNERLNGAALGASKGPAVGSAYKAVGIEGIGANS